MVRKKPNFFIVGAPKCGTSFLHENLILHPDLFMCPVKSLNYFDTDLHYTSPRLSSESYLKLFKKAGSRKVIGEASSYYLYSQSAPKAIYEFDPDAKIIIMLRNPVEMMYSLYYEHLYQGNEVEKEFAKALDLEENRKQGKNIHRNSNPAECVYYKDLGSYAGQVARYFSLFPSDKILVIIYDDLKKDPEEVFKRTLAFLNVDQEFKINPTVINPAKKPRSIVFRELVLRPPALLRDLIRVVIPVHSIRTKIQKRLKMMNTRFIAREPVDPMLADRLKKEMASDVVRLSKMLGRDLTHWVS